MPQPNYERNLKWISIVRKERLGYIQLQVKGKELAISKDE
jgi:hypothetical protein